MTPFEIGVSALFVFSIVGNIVQVIFGVRTGGIIKAQDKELDAFDEVLLEKNKKIKQLEIDLEDSQRNDSPNHPETGKFMKKKKPKVDKYI